MTKKAYLSILFVILITIVVVIIVKHKTFNWKEQYSENGKDPYDNYAITQLLKNNSFGANIHEILTATDSSLKYYHGTNNTYVCIGDQLNLKDTNVNDLVTFVAQGNTAFISLNFIPQNLIEKLINKKCDSPVTFFFNKNKATLHLQGKLEIPKVELVYNSERIIASRSWGYINVDGFCSDKERILSLGYIDNNNKTNFIRYAYGRGNFYFHLTPLIFTNYYITNPASHQYIENVLSVIDTGNIILDEWSKMTFYNSNENTNPSTTPLSFILSHRGLRWAWYSALVLLIIYMLFIGKRRQKIIPIIVHKKNTSLEYIKAIGLLYNIERIHRSACINKMKHFQLFVKSRYNLSVKNINEENIEKLHLFSGVNKEHIQNIFNDYNYIDRTINLDDDYLISFHNQLSYFYKQCK